MPLLGAPQRSYTHTHATLFFYPQMSRQKRKYSMTALEDEKTAVRRCKNPRLRKNILRHLATPGYDIIIESDEDQVSQYRLKLRPKNSQHEPVAPRYAITRSDDQTGQPGLKNTLHNITAIPRHAIIESKDQVGPHGMKLRPRNSQEEDQPAILQYTITQSEDKCVPRCAIIESQDQAAPRHSITESDHQTTRQKHNTRLAKILSNPNKIPAFLWCIGNDAPNPFRLGPGQKQPIRDQFENYAWRMNHPAPNAFLRNLQRQHMQRVWQESILRYQSPEPPARSHPQRELQVFQAGFTLQPAMSP
jgi:hypothetical protein